MLKHLPLKKPKPNAAEFVDILMGRSTSKRVPLVEYLVDDTLMKPILGDMLGRKWVVAGSDRD
jgi:hypothetical protein